MFFVLGRVVEPFDRVDVPGIVGVGSLALATLPLFVEVRAIL